MIVRPDFLYGTIGSDIEKNCFRAFQHDHNTACIMIDNTKSWGAQVLALLVNTDRLFYEQPFCYELRIKGLLCEVFAEILSRHETGMTCTKPSQVDLRKLFRHILDATQVNIILSANKNYSEYKEKLRFRNCFN